MNFKMFVLVIMAVVTMNGCSFVELSLLKYESRKVAIPEKVALAKSSVALADITKNQTTKNGEADVRVLDATLITGVIGLLKAIYSQLDSANDINKEVVEIKEFSVFSIKVGDNDKKTSAVVSDKGDITAKFID